MLRMAMTIFAVLFTVSLGFATDASPYAEIDGLIAKNDLAGAMAKVDAGLAADANSVEHIVRQSRVVSLMGDANPDKAKKVEQFEKAQKLATRAIKLDGENAGGYLRRAVSAGKLALYKGILQSRALVLGVKKDASKVLELSKATEYQKALANYLLGRAHMKLAEKPRALRIPLGLGWASKKKGEEHLKKAATMAPQSIPFNLDWARHLIKKGNKDEAKAILAKIKDLEILDPADPGHKKEAEKLLAGL